MKSSRRCCAAVGRSSSSTATCSMRPSSTWSCLWHSNSCYRRRGASRRSLSGCPPAGSSELSPVYKLSRIVRWLLGGSQIMQTLVVISFQYRSRRSGTHNWQVSLVRYFFTFSRRNNDKATSMPRSAIYTKYCLYALVIVGAKLISDISHLWSLLISPPLVEMFVPAPEKLQNLAITWVLYMTCPLSPLVASNAKHCCLPG